MRIDKIKKRTIYTQNELFGHGFNLAGQWYDYLFTTLAVLYFVAGIVMMNL